MDKPVRSQEEIDEMRRRLYDRGSNVGESNRHELTDEKVDVSRDWNNAHVTSEQKTDVREGMTVEVGEFKEEKPKRRYRMVILLSSLGIFTFVAVISTLFLYFGGNQISGDNIQVSLNGPNFVGGGDIVAMQLVVSNDNSVPIESSTLIIKYPPGTRSVGDDPKNLYEERVELGDIEVGEVRSVPVSVSLFGEENDIREINATVEYRVGGSNSTFEKQAEPLAVRISSSPLVLRVENIEKVASGQLVEVTLTAVSNAATPFTDLLVSASYPNGFSFESSDPAPIYGDNVWKIDELLPEGQEEIKIQGIINGLTDETLRMNFSSGPADQVNPNQIAANLAEGRADFEIERPFIDVGISINNESGRVAVLEEGEDSSISVEITNTLDETVYDMVVEVVPGGNALDQNSIVSSSGFYDSNTGTVRWEVSNNRTFSEVLPGQSRQLDFEVRPSDVKTTASYDLVVNVYARRVNEPNALETLIGTTKAEAKFSSAANVASQAGRSSSDTGPIPPAVGEETVYTLTLAAESGANELSNTIVNTSLPVYVNWLNDYDGHGEITYNSVSKEIEWNVGDLGVTQRKVITMKVSIKPSTSQLKQTPVLLNSQKLRTNDRFTGVLLQDTAPAVTTELSTEMGYKEGNGRVIE